MTFVHRITTRYRQGNVPARLALVVVGLLFGLLGMHALSVGHGVMPGPADQTNGQMSPQASGQMTAQMGGTGHAGHAGTGTGDHAEGGATMSHANAAAASEARSGDGSGSGDHGMGGMLMLCLAVLGAAATLLLGRVFARRLSWWRLALTSAVTAVIPAAPPIRSSGPPPVWEFSVIRC